MPYPRASAEPGRLAVPPSKIRRPPPSDEDRSRAALRRRALTNDMARLHGLAAASQIAIITTDAAGAVTSWNAAAMRIFGKSADVMIGRSIEAIMPERFRSEHDAGMRRMQAGGVSKLAGRTIELVGLRAN